MPDITLSDADIAQIQALTCRRQLADGQLQLAIQGLLLTALGVDMTQPIGVQGNRLHYSVTEPDDVPVNSIPHPSAFDI